MNFKIGQKVVCIHNGEWVDAKTEKDCFIYPEFGEVVTIEEIDDNGYLGLKEYCYTEPKKFLGMTYGFERVGYSPNCFKPIVTIESKEQLEYQIKELSQCYTTQN